MFKRKFELMVTYFWPLLACTTLSWLTMSFVIWPHIDDLYGFFFASNPEVSPRNIQKTDGFEQQWEKTINSSWVWALGDSNADDEDHSFMFVKDNQLILSVWNFDNPFAVYTSLNSYNTITGEPNWQTTLDMDSSPSIGKNSDTIFVLVTDYARTRKFCNPDFRCSVFKVSAYDTISGNFIWGDYPEELFYSRWGTEINISDNRLYLVNRDDTSVTVCLDAASGSNVSDCEQFEFTQPNNDPNSWIIPESFYYNSQNIVSNFAQNNDYAFFMTARDQSLWGIDKTSLEKVMSVKFEGPLLKKGERYYITANEETVVVYMDDSHQLIAFDLP